MGHVISKYGNHVTGSRNVYYCYKTINRSALTVCHSEDTGYIHELLTSSYFFTVITENDFRVVGLVSIGKVELKHVRVSPENVTAAKSTI